MPINKLRERMDRISVIIISILIAFTGILLIIVYFFTQGTAAHLAVSIGSVLFSVLVTIGFVTFLSLQIVPYTLDFRLGFRRGIKGGLTSMLRNEHRLSNVELRGTVRFLRGSLRDLWNFKTPIDTTRLEEGLTSIADDTSHLSHYELNYIKMMLERGRRRLRRARFALIVGIAFMFFLVGCVTGMLFEHWVNLIK